MSDRRMRIAGQVALLAVLLATETRPAAAQWVEEPGSGWISATVFHHDTRRRFDEEGNVESLFNEGGRSIATSLFLTGVYGVYRGVDVWAEVPFHRLEFNDVVENRRSTGFGDPRFHVRIGPELFLGRKLPVPVAIRGGVKFSVGDFPVDTEIIPITEGQRDWEIMLELGHSFWPRSEYVMGWIGYRWREENSEIVRDFGDEVFVFVSGGGRIRSWSWKMTLEGLFGRPPEVFGLTIEGDRRRLFQIMPSIGRSVGPGGLEIGTRIPVAGLNLPAGPAVFTSYFWRIGG